VDLLKGLRLSLTLLMVFLFQTFQVSSNGIGVKDYASLHPNSASLNFFYTILYAIGEGTVKKKL